LLLGFLQLFNNEVAVINTSNVVMHWLFIKILLPFPFSSLNQTVPNTAISQQSPLILWLIDGIGLSFMETSALAENSPQQGNAVFEESLGSPLLQPSQAEFQKIS
jgi:hypothetical protein